MIASVRNWKEFALEYPDVYCRYRNGLRDIFALKREASGKPVPKVIWMCGPTGVGKSKFAYTLSDDCYEGDCSMKWFDGYIG